MFPIIGFPIIKRNQIKNKKFNRDTPYRDTRIRDTIGKISQELLQKEPDTRDPIELQREIHKSYEANIMECVENSKKTYPNDFYVVVETKKERLMPNVIRNYIFARHSCPTPSYDQTVYKYHRKEDRVEFLWVIPSKDTCELLRNNALLVVEDERQLLNFVLDFYDNTLLRLAKKLNNEQVNSLFLETG